jgi:hypothetical protein
LNRRTYLNLKASQKSWKRGEEFVDLHDKLCSYAISEIRTQMLLVENNEYTHSELAGSFKSYSVIRPTQSSVLMRNTFALANFTKKNVLPCRHLLYLSRALELQTYESFSFLSRWLKEVG